MSWNQAAFSRRLNQLLDARGWTQQDLAAAIHTHRRNVSRWQSNPRNHPSYDHMEAMARALNVSPGFLAFGEGATAEELALLAKWRRLTPRRRQMVRDVVDEFSI